MKGAKPRKKELQKKKAILEKEKDYFDTYYIDVHMKPQNKKYTICLHFTSSTLRMFTKSCDFKGEFSGFRKRVKVFKVAGEEIFKVALI